MARPLLLLIALLLLPSAGRAAVVALAAGAGHTCAVTDDGRLWCWGDGRHGQLGDGRRASRPAPSRVPDLVDVAEVALGHDHTCARLRSGRVSCFGRNDHGQLGDGSRTDRATPAPVEGIEGAVALAAGSHHTCALLGDGEARCWGLNRYGQLGDGTRFAFQPRPVRVVGFERARAVTAGFAHTCVLTEAGTARCFGGNFSGQVGDGTAHERRTAVEVPGLSDVVELEAGEMHTCARRASGEVVCWGVGAGGQLGDGSPLDRSAPVRAERLSPARELLVGGSFTCAIHGEGLRCVGGRFGQEPREVTLAGASAWSAGARHACAIVSGDVLCFGENDRGQLGNGARGGLPSATPLAVSLPSPAVGLAAADSRTCARVDDGVLCWGAGEPSPRRAGGTSAEAELRGERTGLSCSVDRRGRVRCARGKKKRRVPGLKRAREVAAGQRFACALEQSGAVACWGEGLRGELGQGTLLGRSRKALPVAGLEGAVQIGAGRFFACALEAHDAGPSARVVGAARCWGANERGQLGDGTFAHRPTPGAVPGLEEAVQITTGDAHACALHEDGTVSCWGDGAEGQLGDGRYEARPTPRKVEGLEDVVEVRAASAHTCARTKRGEVLCWGAGARGELGQGAPLDVATPQPVVGLPDTGGQLR